MWYRSRRFGLRTYPRSHFRLVSNDLANVSVSRLNLSVSGWRSRAHPCKPGLECNAGVPREMFWYRAYIWRLAVFRCMHVSAEWAVRAVTEIVRPIVHLMQHLVGLKVAALARWLMTRLTDMNIFNCSIEIEWDGKKSEIWYDNEMKWIRLTVWNETFHIIWFILRIRVSTMTAI